MTIRRLLKKPDKTPIPEKYHVQFDSLFPRSSSQQPLFSSPHLEAFRSFFRMSGPGNFEPLLAELETEGKNYDDLEKLERDTKDKLKSDKNIGAELAEKVLKVGAAIFAKDLPWKLRATCIGALLYFINPFDLIPDSIPVIGYLDDFAVITLALGMLVKYQAENQKKEEKEAT